MLHIILGILKIIGIILISIVGLLLMLLLLSLFSPVTYIVRGERAGEEITAKSRVYWLFRTFSMKIWYEKEKLNYIVRLFGFPILSSLKKDKKKKKVKKKRAKKMQTKPKELEKLEVNSDIKDKNEIIKVQTEQQKEQQKKKSVWDKPKAIWLKIKSFWQVFLNGVKDVKKVCKELFAKLKVGKLKISRIIEQLKEEETKEVFLFIKAEFLILIKHIRPRKIKGKIHFGTADPATTGYAIGILGIIYPMLPRKLIVQPDFEQEIYEGNIYMKGRIQSYVLVRSAWKIYKDKKIKKIITSIRN
jgi:Protein of unknown function (DUF2953).